MAETYYEYATAHLGTNEAPSGTYTRSGPYSVTIDAEETWRGSTSASCVVNLSGDIATWETTSALWFNGGLVIQSTSGTRRAVIFEIKDSEGSGISGVTGIGSESPIEAGIYVATPIGDQTFTPAKDDYTFDPSSFTFNGASGDGVHVTITATSIAPTLENPTEDGTNYYLNKDHLLEMRWDDPEGVDISNHTVHFEGVARDDRTRYSIVTYKMFLDVTLDYETTYSWFVRKDLGGGDYIDSDTWQFTTMAYSPPGHSTRTRPPYGGGDDITVPTGENNMITVERLIAIARNKFFYEDV